MYKLIRSHFGQRALLSGLVACAASFGALSVADAGVGGSDRAVAVQGVGGSDLDVLGVVEKSNSKGSAVVVVSGQTVHVVASTPVLQKGTLVAVFGSLNTDGTINASQISVYKQQYVAGATTLYVRGVVRSLNASLARAQVGSLTIDYSSSLYKASSGLAVGKVAEFSGLQTSSTLFASTSGLVTATPSGVGGSDLAKLGVGGSDVTTLGVGGSDVTTLGVGGSDVTTQGVGGSDVTKLGVGGSDVTTLGVGGSDVTKLGVGGSDVTKLGVGGSDITTLGVGGSDKSLL